MPGVRPQIGDILEVRSVCANGDNDQIAINVFHYRMESQGSTAPVLQEIANNFHTAFENQYAFVMPPSCQFAGIGVKNITPPATVEFVSTLPDAAGVGPPGELPNQVSYVVNFKTILSGRGHRGRCYPGFPPRDHANAQGNMSIAGITAVQLWASGFPITQNTGGGSETAVFRAVVLRRTQGGLPLPFPSYDFITTCTARLRFGTQRRRGDFGRTNARPLGF